MSNPLLRNASGGQEPPLHQLRARLAPSWVTANAHEDPRLAHVVSQTVMHTPSSGVIGPARLVFVQTVERTEIVVPPRLIIRHSTTARRRGFHGCVLDGEPAAAGAVRWDDVDLVP